MDHRYSWDFYRTHLRIEECGFRKSGVARNTACHRTPNDSPFSRVSDAKKLLSFEQFDFVAEGSCAFKFKIVRRFQHLAFKIGDDGLHIVGFL